MDQKGVDRSFLGKGEYANYFEVWHDFVAFYLDFGQVGTADERTRLFHRIITSPLGAKRLVIVLGETLEDYSRRFGDIRDEEGEAVADDEFKHRH